MTKRERAMIKAVDRLRDAAQMLIDGHPTYEHVTADGCYGACIHNLRLALRALRRARKDDLR